MLISKTQLRRHLLECVEEARRQGRDTGGLVEKLAALPDSYDALAAFSHALIELPQRPDWVYEEPDDFAAIRSAWAPDAAMARPVDAAARIEAAFLGRVCGCMLGKPVEVNPSFEEMRKAGRAAGEWPLKNYVSAKFLEALGRREDGWGITHREGLVCAVPDDDISYTVLAMQLLERHGAGFTHAQQRELWMRNLANGITWGPEHVFLINSSIKSIEYHHDRTVEPNWQDWRLRLNPGGELCGAMIRADAYGYACAGNPALAVELAYRDASLTHVKTGIYGSLYAAAAVALAAVEPDLKQVMLKALAFVPQKSRFATITRRCYDIVMNASNWEQAAEAIATEFGTHTHCAIYQETGNLINSLRFATDTGEAIGLQVSQGNDTDSYGATAGSIAGMFYGKAGLDQRWLAPLNDTIHIGLAEFHDNRLGALALRMARLPEALKS